MKKRIGSHYYLEQTCLTCHSNFWARTDAINKGMGKFCTRNCMGKSYWQESHTPWNKGSKGLSKANSGSFKSGDWKFKGSRTDYINLHNKIRKMFGTPDTCEHCNKNGLIGKAIHWANKSGSYRLEKDDWLRLCAKCHFVYDKVQV